MGEIARKSNASNTVALFVVTLLVMTVITYLVSSSIASVVFVTFCLTIGLLFCFLLLKPKNRGWGTSIFIVTLICYVVIVALKYLAVVNEIHVFSNEDNDHFMFWLESQVGANSSSLSQIFKRCIIDNEYIENGGYYFYIQSLAYYAQHYFDGNHFMLQLLGTALPGMLSSIVIYKLLGKYVGFDSAKRYALLYVLLTPALTVCIGIHRDAWITFFYLCLIYLWLSGERVVKTLIMEVLIAALTVTMRIQSGLFAFAFVFLTAYKFTKKYRWVFYLAIGVVIVFYGSLIISVVNNELKDTLEVYGKLGEESLSTINTGIGRYVYRLPSPVKEVAQIVVLQAQFPPWLGIETANSIPGVGIGLVQLAINFFWFFVFLYSCLMIFKNRAYKQVPIELLFGVGVFFVFLLFNSSNLVDRRVVCVYPCLFMLYVYLRENIVSDNISRIFYKRYKVLYGGLCVLYLGLKMFIG